MSSFKWRPFCPGLNVLRLGLWPNGYLNFSQIKSICCTCALCSVLLLTHWGRVTHICISKLTIIGSDNGLSPSRRQTIIWTKAGILLIRTFATNFSEILSEINTFSFKKMRLKMSSAKWRPFCLGLNVLTHWGRDKWTPFRRRHFQMHFLEWKYLNSD